MTSFKKLIFNAIPTVVLIAAVGLTHVQTVSAQDYEAVQNRLLDAIKNQEITLRQAAEMMEVLMHSNHDHSNHEREMHEREMHEMERRFHQAEREIVEMMEAGKLSRNDGTRKLAEMKREMARMHGNHDVDVEVEVERAEGGRKRKFQEAAQRLELAVKNGRISEADAKKRYAEMKKAMLGNGNAEKSSDDSGMVRGMRRIELAIKEGKISKEDGMKRMAAMKKQMAGRSDAKEDSGQARLKQAVQKIQQAVENGRISKADAKKRIATMKKEMAQRTKEVDATQRERFNEAMEKIKKAVDSGRVSEADAKKRIAQMKERMAASEKATKKKVKPGDTSQAERQKKVAGMQARVADIKAAVKAGKMTREDAAQKIERLQKQVDVPLTDKSKVMDKKRNAAEAEQRKKRTAEIRARATAIKQAVVAGKLSREEAEKAMERLQKRTDVALDAKAKQQKRKKTDTQNEDRAKRDRDDTRNSDSATGDNVRRRIEKAVRDGVMDREQAKKALAERAAKVNKEKAKVNKEKANAKSNVEEKADAKPGARRLEAAMKRLDAAVKAGRMSKEKADETRAAIKKRFSERDKD